SPSGFLRRWTSWSRSASSRTGGRSAAQERITHQTETNMETTTKQPEQQSPASAGAAGSTAVCLTEETFEAIMDHIIGRANCRGGWWNDNRTFNLVNRIRRETGRRR